MSCSRYRDTVLFDAGVPAGNPVPTRPGDPTPIEHVIYIVKENRTYDQVFGDLKEGNGTRHWYCSASRSAPTTASSRASSSCSTTSM
jgi:phospholipase C